MRSLVPVDEILIRCKSSLAINVKHGLDKTASVLHEFQEGCFPRTIFSVQHVVRSEGWILNKSNILAHDVECCPSVADVFHRGSKQQLPRFLNLKKFDVLRHAASTGVDDAEPRDDGAHEGSEALTIYNEIRTKGFDSRTEDIQRVVCMSQAGPTNES